MPSLNDGRDSRSQPNQTRHQQGSLGLHGPQCCRVCPNSGCSAGVTRIWDADQVGNITGILTCAHVLEALCKEAEIGILCFPVRTNQIQTLRLPMGATDCISFGSPPWSERGPDLAFLRLPTTIIGDIERVATVANGDLHRQRIIEGEPTARHVCGLVGVVDQFTKPISVVRTTDRAVGTTSFDVMISLGNLIIDDEDADRFRFQPLASPGVVLPKSYQGSSGGSLWHFYLDQDDFSIVQARIVQARIVQARLVGVAYFEKPMGDELHLLGHGQISIYDILYKAIQQKWS
jgi:hypothetical protein